MVGVAPCRATMWALKPPRRPRKPEIKAAAGEPERTPPEPVVEAVSGGDFHAWAPNGALLMASGSVVYAWSVTSNEWTPIADFSHLNISISRLAISPDGAQIAMVAEIASIPGFPSN